jgi:hypothetical protein
MQTNGLAYFIVGAFLGSMLVGIFLSRNFAKSDFPLKQPKTLIGSWKLLQDAIVSAESVVPAEDNIVTRPGFYIVEDFNKIKTSEEYKQFLKEFWEKKQWIYIVAIKTQDKDLWSRFWSFEYDTNKIITDAYAQKNDFIVYIDDFYEKVINNTVNPDWINDLSIAFSSTNNDINEALKMCEKTVDPVFFKNLVYIYRATSKNNLCEKIDKKISPSLYSLCGEMLSIGKN